MKNDTVIRNLIKNLNICHMKQMLWTWIQTYPSFDADPSLLRRRADSIEGLMKLMSILSDSHTKSSTSTISSMISPFMAFIIWIVLFVLVERWSWNWILEAATSKRVALT